MNIPMVRRLVVKDWYFARRPIAAYLAAGLLSLAFVGFGGAAGFYAGSVLLITAVISAGIHLTIANVVQERSERTLAFVMSLPISPIDYTVSKIVSNVSIFGAAWATLVVGAVATIAARAALPDGLIPFALAVLAQLFTGYCLVLATAIVSESIGWTVGAMVTGNLLVQAVMYVLSNRTAVGHDLQSNAIVWRRPILATLALEAAAVVALLAVTLFAQSRKRHFV